jgi:hypothetical protein
LRKFAEIFASQGAKPVSTPPVANFATCTVDVVDTGGKFTTGVNVLPAENISLVSTTPVANCHPYQ